jgi:hypothetical protein
MGILPMILLLLLLPMQKKMKKRKTKKHTGGTPVLHMAGTAMLRLFLPDSAFAP